MGVFSNGSDISLTKGSSLSPLPTQSVHSNASNSQDLWNPMVSRFTQTNLTQIMVGYDLRVCQETHLAGFKTLCKQTWTENSAAYSPGTSEAQTSVEGVAGCNAELVAPPGKVFLPHHRLTRASTRQWSGMLLFCLTQAFGCSIQAPVPIIP